MIIDTAGLRWRHLAAVGLAVPLSFALAGTASAASPQSAADLSIDVSCFGIEVTSDKDISNVKVTFADGTTQEISLSGLTFTRTFDERIVSATAKSGTEEVSGTPTGCAATPAPADEDEDEVAPVVTPVVLPVQDDTDEDVVVPDTANSTAAITITVDCRTVRVVSDKDISNVKVTFVDGTTQEIEGLSGLTFERTFGKDIAEATSKSATTEVLGTATGCAAAAPVVTTPVVVPVVTTPVVAPVVTTPVTGAPAPLPANGGGTPVVDSTPVVAEETPEQSTVLTPIAGQPAPQTAVGAAGAMPAPAAPAPVAGTPAQAPAVVANGAVAPAALAPTELATAAPATLPFTGADTDALVALGSVLVLAGGGAMIAGRRTRGAKHARTAKHARLA